MAGLRLAISIRMASEGLDVVVTAPIDSLNSAARTFILTLGLISPPETRRVQSLCTS